MSTIGNQQLLKEINKSLLLNMIYQQGPISRVDLSRNTKLSPTTVSVLIEEAIREGIVHEIGTSGSGVGRRMTMLNIKGDNGYVLGIDLSNSPFRCVLLNLHGEVVASHPFNRLIGEEKIRGHLVETIQLFIEKQGIDLGIIRWMGVSVSGLIDDNGEAIIASAYLKIKQFPLKQLLYEAFGVPVHLVNDLDAAGFAERFNGAAKGYRAIVYTLIDYGIGAGLVIDNHIYRGVSGQAGRTGQLYRYGTDALSQQLTEQYPDTFEGLAPEEVIQSFVQFGMEGKIPFKSELDDILHGMARYCGSVLQLLNPEQMILCGWVIKNEAFFAQLVHWIQQYESSFVTPTPVKASFWKEQGAAIGAATLGLHQIFKSKHVN